MRGGQGTEGQMSSPYYSCKGDAHGPDSLGRIKSCETTRPGPLVLIICQRLPSGLCWQGQGSGGQCGAWEMNPPQRAEKERKRMCVGSVRPSDQEVAATTPEPRPWRNSGEM